MRLRIRCPAKVNLHLEVHGRRADGYHELRTLFAAVGLWDELEIEPGPPGEVTLTVEPPGSAPTDEGNLVVRAANVLARTCGRSPGARLRLSKTIPTAGGLGGGSSDAAAALVGLTRMWGMSLSDETLRVIAADLGADVPFFLLGGTAWGTGRGSDLRALPDLRPWWVVLLAGPEPVPTSDVYRRFREGPVDARPPSEVQMWVMRGGELPLSACRNDLEPGVVEGWPEVERRLRAVRETDPLLAQLSGSGGTVFAVYAAEVSARSAAQVLDSWRPIVAPLLTRERSRLRVVEE